MKNFRDFLEAFKAEYPELGRGLAECANLDRAFRFLNKVGFFDW